MGYGEKRREVYISLALRHTHTLMHARKGQEHTNERISQRAHVRRNLSVNAFQAPWAPRPIAALPLQATQSKLACQSMATKAVRETNGILCPLTSVAGLEDCNPIPTARGSRRQLWRREKVHPVHATSRPPPACFPRLTCPSGARDWWRPVPGSLTRPHAHTHAPSGLLHVRQRTLTISVHPI